MIKCYLPKLFPVIAGLLIAFTLCVSWVGVLALPARADTSLSCGITTSHLPSGTVDTAYSASLAASGGATPYTWTFEGALPDGLSLDSATGAETSLRVVFTVEDSFSQAVPSQKAI